MCSINLQCSTTRTRLNLSNLQTIVSIKNKRSSDTSFTRNSSKSTPPMESTSTRRIWPETRPWVSPWESKTCFSWTWSLRWTLYVWTTWFTRNPSCISSSRLFSKQRHPKYFKDWSPVARTLRFWCSFTIHTTGIMDFILFSMRLSQNTTSSSKVKRLRFLKNIKTTSDCTTQRARTNLLKMRKSRRSHFMVLAMKKKKKTKSKRFELQKKRIQHWLNRNLKKSVKDWFRVRSFTKKRLWRKTCSCFWNPSLSTTSPNFLNFFSKDLKKN